MPPVAEQPWFKHWAEKSLRSYDLASLTDHEERVWWRLLAATSLQEPRWSIPFRPAGLAILCASTPTKVRAAVASFVERGMVSVEAEILSINNWEQYQESPSAARVRRFRANQKGVTQAVTVTPNVTGCVTDLSYALERAEEDRGQRLETPKGVRAASAQPKPGLDDDYLEALQVEEPSLDIKAFAADYLNWKGSRNHKDKRQGFRNQLRIEWKREQFRKVPASVTGTGPKPEGPKVLPLLNPMADGWPDARPEPDGTLPPKHRAEVKS